MFSFFFWTFFRSYLSSLGCNLSNLSVLNSRFPVFQAQPRPWHIAQLLLLWPCVRFSLRELHGGERVWNLTLVWWRLNVKTWGASWIVLYHQHFWWSWFYWDCQKIISEQAKEKDTFHVKLRFFMFNYKIAWSCCLISVCRAYFHYCKTTESRDHVVYTLMIVFYLHQE